MKFKVTDRYQDDDLRIPSLSWGIFFISLLGLFMETLFIRWVGTEIRIFAYLQNTILVVCFVGLGIGMFTSSRPIAFKQSLIPLTLFLFLMAIPATRTIVGSTSEMLSTLGDLLLWGSMEVSSLTQRMVYLLTRLRITFIVLILLVDIFVPIGRTLGRLMDASTTPIWSYSVNIIGSILGTWLFVLFSYFYQPPFVWFLATAGLLGVFIVWSNRDRKINFVLLGLILVLSWFAGQVPDAIKVVWSPYQKLVVRENPPNGIGAIRIDVKHNSGYQGIIDLSEANVAARPELFSPRLEGLSQYDLPMLFHPNPKSVLLVGAGAGNDAAGALRQNVESGDCGPLVALPGRAPRGDRPAVYGASHTVHGPATRSRISGFVQA